MKKPKPKAKKQARARAARPAPATDAEDSDKKLADVLLAYVEPHWPGTPPKWAKSDALAEHLRNARFWIERALRNEGSEKLDAVNSWSLVAKYLCAWLAATAANGESNESKLAQSMICDLARQTTDNLIAGYHSGWEVAIARAHKMASVPGFISRHPAMNRKSQEMLVKIGQGEAVPNLVKQTGKRGKSPRAVDSPAQRLVACLFDYMTALRSWCPMLAMLDDLEKHAPSRVREILALSPFAKGTCAAWEEASWGIMADFSPHGDPSLLPALESDILRPLLRATKRPLREVHRKAWQALAK